MSLITWDQSYSVKVAQLDDDHQKLFSYVNTLHEAMHAGKGSSVIQSIVADLVNYTQTHFHREEALMEQTKFPGREAHRREHQKLIAQVGNFRKALDSGERVNTVAVLEFLREWLTKHIHGMDKGYSTHLNSNGVH
jgi:hemerythrin